MGAYVSLAMLMLAGFAALEPGTMPWVYIAALIGFEAWLMRRMALTGRAPALAGVAPYHFSDEEAALFGRYRFYFTYPAIARESSFVIGALGLSTLALAPWLTFRHAFVSALLIGLNLFAIARLTRQLAPLMALRVAVSRGDRAALRMLELHDPVWQKIRSANQA